MDPLPTERVNTCPCGSSETTFLKEFVFWSQLGLRRCDSCGLFIVSPRLTKDAMRYVFRDHYFDYSNLEVWGKRRKRVFADIVHALKSRGVQNVFDVGAAFGHFVRYAEKSGLRASGSDFSDNAVKVARQRFGVALHAGSLGDLSLSRGSFDAVVSLDTFYYVADPHAELDAIRTLLRPNGVLVLRLRNCRRSQLPSQHLWGFTPKSISSLLERAGWRVEQCLPASYSASPLQPFHVLIVWANRILRRAFGRTPILTHSFNIIARPAAALKSPPPTY